MATNDKGLTPMMRQFFSMKEKHPEALLLFRCGDFYETYCDDAVEAARILGITLTRRNNGAASGAEMAGFPHHALDTYLPKLIRAGKRVAICDQLEDPKKKRAAIKGKKGLSEMDKMVKRGITELVTPGVAMGDNVLNYKENNFLAAIHFGKGACGVSLLDISTGEFLTGEGNYDYVEKLLGNFQPKEVLYDRTRKQDFEQQFGTKFVTFELDDWVFTDQTARQKLLKHFKTKNLKGFGVDHLRNGIVGGRVKALPPALPVLRQHPPRQTAPGGKLPRQRNEPAGDVLGKAMLFPRHGIHRSAERKHDIRSFCSHFIPPTPAHGPPLRRTAPRLWCSGAKS